MLGACASKRKKADMAKQFTTLSFLDKAGPQQPRKSGQPQTEESVERDRKFAERAAAIEKLKKARVDTAAAVKPAVAKPASKARRKVSKE
jgi:hypothetical protein